MRVTKPGNSFCGEWPVLSVEKTVPILCSGGFQHAREHQPVIPVACDAKAWSQRILPGPKLGFSLFLQ